MVNVCTRRVGDRWPARPPRSSPRPRTGTRPGARRRRAACDGATSSRARRPRRLARRRAGSRSTARLRAFRRVPGPPASTVRMLAAGRRWTPSTIASGPRRSRATGTTPRPPAPAGAARPEARSARTSEAKRITSSPSRLFDGGPVERLDAHGIAHEMDGPRARVPQGEAKMPRSAAPRRGPSACRP
jgi:hypothetical protein